MKYKIAILLFAAVLLTVLADRLIIEYTKTPCAPCSKNICNCPPCDKTSNSSQTENITYKTFSSPKADFTFEYPDTWVYDEKIDPENPNTTGWNFYEGPEKKFDIPILAVISPLTEVVDFCSVGYKGAKTPYQLNTFSTNDNETFVTYEQCGGEYGGAYIYWRKGEYFANASLINDIHKINLMNFYSGSEEGKKIAQHIAQSIKIK